MNKALHSSLLTVVIAVTAYALAVLYSGSDQVLSAFRSLSLELWLLLLLFSLINYVLRYWRWHLYISHQSSQTISHIQHFSIYIAGFALTMTPGKAGEAMRSLYLKQYGISHQSSIAALFVERIMDLLTILLIAGLGASFLSGDQSVIATAVTLLMITAALVIIKVPKQKLINSTVFKRLPEKLRGAILFIESMLKSANELLSFRFLCVGLLLGLIAWGFEGFGLYLTMEAFQESINMNASNTIPLAMAIYAMAVLIGAISFLPGGLGGTEAVMMVLLIKAGFDEASAVAITFICRIVTLWFAMALGVIMMFILSSMGMKPNKMTDNVNDG